MFLRILFLFLVLSESIDSFITVQSCADIIRPSQTYIPADGSLTIGTVLAVSYQECGRECRRTTLCRTAVWCQGQCTMYQEYIAFGKRSADLNCMLITLSGIAFNEIEPKITIVNHIVYIESQSKYYEQTYAVNSLNECAQLCRLDSHCLTASYQFSTNYCSLFAEHVSQGRNTTDNDWSTIVLDTCAGRDPRIYPCLIDATQTDRKLCDLLAEIRPIKLVPPNIITEPNGYTGGLTKSSIYWPITINGEGAVLRASDDLTNISPLLMGYEWQMIDGKYSHLYVDQRSETAVVYIISKSLIDSKIHRLRLTNEKITEQDFLSNTPISKPCQRCYFAIDSTNAIYISMDNINTIERYEINVLKMTSIFIPSPAGIIVRNDDLWLVNRSHLIILSPRLLPDRSLTYLIVNQIDLSSLSKPKSFPPVSSSSSSSSATFLPFHLDVDNYGRLYITGALRDLRTGNQRPQLYILTDVDERVPTMTCAGSWGMYGVHVYHSKLKLRLLTSMNDLFFHFYSNS